jgi:hypothetical protein
MNHGYGVALRLVATWSGDENYRTVTVSYPLRPSTFRPW